MKIRLMRISFSLLADLLHLPADTQLIAVSDDVEFGRDRIVFKVRSESFEDVEVPEGAMIPEVVAEYQRNPDAIFVGWSEG